MGQKERVEIGEKVTCLILLTYIQSIKIKTSISGALSMVLRQNFLRIMSTTMNLQYYIIIHLPKIVYTFVKSSRIKIYIVI